MTSLRTMEDSNCAELTVLVWLDSYIAFLCDALNMKKSKADNLKSSQRFELKIRPCSWEVYVALLNLCGCEPTQDKPEVIVHDARKLDRLFGQNWEFQPVSTDEVPDGHLCLNSKLRCPIIFSFNSKKHECKVLLFFILYNKQNHVIG